MILVLILTIIIFWIFFLFYVFRRKNIQTKPVIITKIIVLLFPILLFYLILWQYIIPKNNSTSIYKSQMSPDNNYKVEIQKKVQYGSINGDEFFDEFYVVIKINDLFPNTILYKKIHYSTEIAWSKDSSKVAIWNFNHPIFAYNLKSKKPMNLNDKIPKPLILNVIEQSNTPNFYLKNIKSMEDVFFRACKFGDNKIISYIIKNNIEFTSIQYLEGFIFALQEKHYNTASVLLPELNFDIPLGKYLYDSVYNKQKELFNVLIEYASIDDINYRDQIGQTPLMIATQSGQFEMIQRLIQYGADINLEDAIHQSSLGLIIDNKQCLPNKIQIKNYLLELGATVSNYELGHFLFVSINENYRDLFNQLFPRATIDDINHHDIDQLTPLIIASQKGHFEIVNALVEAGADVNAGDVAGETAIYHAMFNQHYHIVEFLIRHGADPAVKGIAGNSFIEHPRMQEILNKITNE